MSSARRFSVLVKYHRPNTNITTAQITAAITDDWVREGVVIKQVSEYRDVGARVD
jgi:hypothetical protein